MNFKKLCVLFFLALPLGSLISAHAEDLTLSQQEENVSYPITAGEMLHISLEENPSTGATWTYKSIPDGAVELVSKNYADSGEIGDVLGANRTGTWHFQANHPGKATLILSYARFWENSIMQQININLDIK